MSRNNFVELISMKKRVLGLDIGIASLGWAVVDIDEELMTTKNKNESKYKINSGEIAVICLFTNLQRTR